MSQGRAEVLSVLEEGLVSLPDVVSSAASGDPVTRSLPLELVMRSTDPRGWRSRIARAHRVNADVKETSTLGDVTDPRCNGRRVAALAASDGADVPVWPGFPYSDPPQEWMA